jgi:hypothetical protein
MDDSPYLVGIDLGTSNCAMAYAEAGRGPEAPVVDFPIPQFTRPGETSTKPLLPSCIYLAAPHESLGGSAQLPWSCEPAEIVGELARWQGARVPGRLVVSAKSWLCHSGVDRTAPILPWGSPADAPKLSPVTASSHLLTHMANAWNAAHPEAPLAGQEVVITVPASFDEVARALTVRAAQEAGLKKFTLLEEPQAAFYDFTARHRNDLAPALKDVRLVLVVDVGGGTSDFTLVQVNVSLEGPVLRRIAVGEHLMLGGDNMDAALSRLIEQKMIGGARRLSMNQWNQLNQLARTAKEALLSANRKISSKKKGASADASADHFNLSIVAEGSRLIGSALSARLLRTEAEQAVLDGFLPACHWNAKPQRGPRAALQEVSLPYAQDPAITRHLAAFLQAHAPAAREALGLAPETPGLPRPDAILLNGGVFNSEPITRKLVEVVSSWWPEVRVVPVLEHDSLDLAVARGAAYYGLVRRGLGQRISGGSAHALFVGLEKAGSEQPMALCVIPRGQEEGDTVELGGRVFQLSLGRPVRFPLYSTASDRIEKSGEIVPVTEDLQPLPPIHTLLKGSETPGGKVPVHLQATLTEIGTLELSCVSNVSKERWRLEFELRGEAVLEGVTVTESMPPTFSEARCWVDKFFGGKGGMKQPGHGSRTNAPKDVKQLWATLEAVLGSREEWRVPVLRELWGVLLAGAGRRRRSVDHERVFFQLLGYTLRPGFGYPLDDWRCEQSAKLFGESVQFQNEKAVWKEFWVLWRRVAGGLNQQHQGELWNYLKPYLALRVAPKPGKQSTRPKGVQPEGLDEMARLAASLEHLPWQEKVEFGSWVTDRLREPGMASGPWTWAIGRLGARAPIYGSIHQVVPPEIAAEWVGRLLDREVLHLEGALFALAQLARLTGDRSRDLDERARAKTLAALKAADASPSWQRMVSEIVPLAAADRARALGDTLPVGLLLD